MLDYIARIVFKYCSSTPFENSEAELWLTQCTIRCKAGKILLSITPPADVFSEEENN
jgi:hypothetical protein